MSNKVKYMKMRNKPFNIDITLNSDGADTETEWTPENNDKAEGELEVEALNAQQEKDEDNPTIH